MRIVLLAGLLLPNSALALDLGLDGYDCTLTRQCSFADGCSDAAQSAKIRASGPDSYALELSDAGEGFTKAVTREQLGDWNAYSFDDLPSFRSILVINKDGNASLTSLGSFFDELVSLQFYGTCVAAAE